MSRLDEVLRRPGVVALLLFLVAAIATAPVLLNTYYNTNDGPVHIAMAMQMSRLLEGQQGLLAQIYELNKLYTPNSLIYFSIIGLMEFMDPVAAEKVVQCAAIVAVALAGAYLTRADPLRALLLACFAGAFAHNQMFQLGLYAFMLAMALWIALIGVFLRWRAAPTPALTGALFVGFTLLYFLHAFVCVFGIALIVGSQAAMAAVRWIERGWSAPETVRELRGLLWTLAPAAVIPAALVIAFFVAGALEAPPNPAQATVGGGMGVQMPRGNPLNTIGDRIWRLARFWSFWAHHGVLIRQAFIVAFWVAALALAARRALLLARAVRAGEPALRAEDPLMAIAIGAGLLTLVMPDHFAGSWTHSRRFELMAEFATAAWIAVSLPRRWLAPATVVAAALLIDVSADSARAHARFSAQMDKIVELAPAIDRPGLMLPVVYSLQGVGERGAYFSRIQPFFHGFVRLEQLTPAISLANYLTRLDVYPIRFRADADPYRHLFTDWPTRRISMTQFEVLDLENYERETGMRVEYLGVFGDPVDSPTPGLPGNAQRLIDAYFEEARCDKERIACLYVRRPGPDP